MPAWSHEIANEFIRLASADARAFDQMHLQELVYIAHGWCLALTGQPLTGDRPEALNHGPEYRRIAEALGAWGTDPVTRVVAHNEDRTKTDATLQTIDLFAEEREIVARTYAEYGPLATSQLASVTRADGTPWDEIYADGAGERRDIPHKLIEAQFAEVAAKLDRQAARY